MPLKHSTETFLVVLLGVALLITGFIIAFLPPLREGYVPWGVVFGVSLLYPLVLYPLLRGRRADNEFRLLHFLPAFLLLLWLGVQVALPVHGTMARVDRWYHWGWALPVIALGFLLLILFCLKVLRQRKMRVIVLLLLFVPFAVAAVASERRGWNPVIASALRTPSFWNLPARFWVASQPGAEEQSSEAAWQMQLRRMLRRSDRLAKDTDIGSSAASRVSASSKRSQASSRPLLARTAKAPKLPPSGFGTEVMIPLMLAGYTGTVHWRAKRRNKR